MNKKHEDYQEYVKAVTPKHNMFINMFRAFWTGGAICTLGQLLSDWFKMYGADEKTAGICSLIILILLSIVLTAFHVYGKLTKYAGAGLLVPITGFANSVASPAVEASAEGEIFGKGVQIFTIAGPVILYGVLSSWVLGLIYYILRIM